MARTVLSCSRYRLRSECSMVRNLDTWVLPQILSSIFLQTHELEVAMLESIEGWPHRLSFDRGSDDGQKCNLHFSRLLQPGKLPLVQF